MGTRGNKVYRHKGRYYIYYNHWDSYPHGFGLKVLRDLPRNVSKEEFEEWLRKTREDVYAQGDSEGQNDPDSSKYLPYKPPEVGDRLIEWIYEIDLDNLVFHVNNHPLYRLDNMPPDDIFMDCMSFDHFGHRALHEHTPAEFRYDWRSPPPIPTPESLAAYHSFHIRSSISSVHDLLDIPVALSSIEHLRTTFIELLVTRRMSEYKVGRYARVLENVPDRDHIPKSMLELAVFIVKFAVGPPIYSLDYHYCFPYDHDFVWIRKDACLRITTHLDDEDNLRASIGDLVNHINTTPGKVGTVYGIACSIFHCAIVRVDKDELGISVAHTPAFQFLPSFYARTMFTTGIEALSRLGCQTSGVEFLDLISDKEHMLYGRRNRKHTFTKYREFAVVTGSAAEKIPVEVWTRIGDFFTSSTDLVNLALISPQALLAAGDLTRYPWVQARHYPNWIDEFRLEDVVSRASPIQEAAGRISRKVIRKYYHQLGRAKFTAVIDGRRLTVDLVQDDEDAWHNPDEDENLECPVPGKSSPISYRNWHWNVNELCLDKCLDE